MNKTSIRKMIITALFSAIICLLSPWAIPFSAVPVTLSLFAVLLTGSLLSPLCSVTAVVIYILIGAVGLPVFSGMNGGIGFLLGPTGGYILSYPLMVLSQSVILKNTKLKCTFKNIIAIVAALVICYIIGTLWFSLITLTPILPSFVICVLPFIPFDILKSVGVIAVAFSVYKTPVYQMLKR